MRSDFASGALRAQRLFYRQGVRRANGNPRASAGVAAGWYNAQYLASPSVAAYGMFSDKLPAPDCRRDSFEIALELNYKFQVNRFFFLQPNIQYIVNTNGGEYPNATVLRLQFGLNL